MSGVRWSDSRRLAALSQLPHPSPKGVRPLWASDGIVVAGLPILQHSRGGSYSKSSEHGDLVQSNLSADHPAYSAAPPRSRSIRNN